MQASDNETKEDNSTNGSNQINVNLTELEDIQINQLIQQTKVLLEKFPKYKENIEKHTQSLEKTSKIVKQASNNTNHNSGHVAFFTPPHRSTLLMQALEKLLFTVGSQNITENKLLPYIDEYNNISTELKMMNFNPSRVVINQTLENGYKIFEGSLQYFNDYQLLKDLIEALDMLITRYSTLLLQLNDFYRNNSENSEEKPKIYNLVKDMGNLKKGFSQSEYDYLKIVDGKNFPNWLKNETKEKLVERFKTLAPAYHEFYADQTLKLMGSDYAINNLICNRFKTHQEKIDQANNMAQVLPIATSLETGIEKLYLFHWIYETFFKWINRNKSKSSLLGYRSKEWHREPSLGVALNSLLRNKNFPIKNKEIIKNFKYNGVNFRNNVAHQGIIYNPNGFKKAIKAYRNGGQFSVIYFKTNLDKVPKNLPELYNPKKAQKAMEGFLKYMTEEHNSHKVVNGFSNNPDTQLTYNDLKRNNYLSNKTFKSKNFTQYYHLPADKMDKFRHYFFQILASHFSKTLINKEISYHKLKNICTKAMLEEGIIEEGQKPYGLTRALFMTAKSKNIEDPILDQKAYSPNNQESKTVREIALLIKTYMDNSNE